MIVFVSHIAWAGINDIKDGRIGTEMADRTDHSICDKVSDHNEP